jgi:hypothetical protein
MKTEKQNLYRQSSYNSDSQEKPISKLREDRKSLKEFIRI